MSETPRTDAMESAFQESGMYGTFSPVALCRTLERDLTEAVRLLEKAYNELNEIHARDGVPYTHMGWKSSVDQDYFTSVVEDCRAFLTSLKERT